MLSGLVTFILMSLMLFMVYGFWKKRHVGSEYNPPSQPPEGRAWGLDTLAKVPDCTLSPGCMFSPASSQKDYLTPR